MTSRVAATNAPILDLLAQRWSPRAFEAGYVIPEQSLNTALEAARWAPSAYNAQPWRFIVTQHGTAAFDKVLAGLVEFNQMWAKNASLLIVNVATHIDAEGRPQLTSEYDLGQAVAYFSMQAHALGLHVHQMSGLDRAALHTSFQLPEGLMPITVMAVGKIAAPEVLPAMLQEKEHAPRTRLALEKLLIGA